MNKNYTKKNVLTDLEIVMPEGARLDREKLNSFIDSCVIPEIVEEFLRERDVEGRTTSSSPVKIVYGTPK